MRAEQLAATRYQDVQIAAMDVLHNLQRKRPEVQLAGLAWLFLLACRRYKLRESEVLTVVGNIIKHADEVAPRYPRAIRQYLDYEWPG